MNNTDLKLEAYIKAINKIDDYFEYHNESVKDREFVHKVLAELTEDIIGTEYVDNNKLNTLSEEIKKVYEGDNYENVYSRIR